MKQKLNFVGLLIAINFAASSFAQQSDFPVLKGPYLGQKPPGETPEIFAQGIVSTEADEYALEISPSGSEILFTRNGSLVLITRQRNGTWNEPVIAPFSGKYIDGESCFSPDGNKIYFCSRRPVPNTKSVRNVWVSEKIEGIWSEPYHLDNLVHTKAIHAPTVSANGNIYDDGIVRFRFVNGAYLPAEKVPQLEGGFPFVSPDESYIIFAKRRPGTYNSDLYIAYHRPDGTWTQSISLGDKINSPAFEGNSFVTADGKYIFFSRKYDIYWMDAKIIEELRPKE
jgi:hypothetical protein